MSNPITFKPGRHRSFIHGSEAWYFEASRVDDRLVDKVSIVLGSEHGGCDYELAIEWRTLLQDEVGVRVVVWHDSWLAFAELADVFAWLATKHGKRVTPTEVCAALLAMGFVDATEREQRR